MSRRRYLARSARTVANFWWHSRYSYENSRNSTRARACVIFASKTCGVHLPPPPAITGTHFPVKCLYSDALRMHLFFSENKWTTFFNESLGITTRETGMRFAFRIVRIETLALPNLNLKLSIVSFADLSGLTVKFNAPSPGDFVIRSVSDRPEPIKPILSAGQASKKLRRNEEEKDRGSRRCGPAEIYEWIWF